MNSAYTTARHVRLFIAALVAALYVVPPLVRATERLDTGSMVSEIRLNRGYALAAPKPKLTSPLRGVSVESVAPAEEHRGRRTTLAASRLDESICDSLSDFSPAAPRAPPNTLAD